MAIPAAMTDAVDNVNSPPGLLRVNGIRLVRMAKMMRVWVASDSTNHPVRNSGGAACNTPSIKPKVKKSKSELTGPNVSMKRLMKAMFQCDGARSCSASTRSVGMASCLRCPSIRT